MDGTDACNIFFKIVELSLSLIIALASVYAEVSTKLPIYYCMTVVGLCGAVCFASLQFMCTIYMNERTFRPVMLLAAAVGAFLFLGLAIYDILRLVVIESPSLILVILCALFCLMSLTLYVDAGIIYYFNPAVKSKTNLEDGKGKNKTKTEDAKVKSKTKPVDEKETSKTNHDDANETRNTKDKPKKEDKPIKEKKPKQTKRKEDNKV